MADAIHLPHLTRAWIHAREEDTEGTSVYRPAGYPLPPSRGRNGFELKPDGSLIQQGPGPTDRTQRTAGTWRMTGNKLELSVGEGSTPQCLHIDSVEPDRLVVRKAPAACPTSEGRNTGPAPPS